MTASGTLTTLYSFKADSVGCYTSAGLLQAKDGSFYGVTSRAGIQPGPNNGFGTVFKITTDGRASPVYLFTGGADGRYPYGELVQGSDGDLYGSVFRLGTNGTLRWSRGVGLSDAGLVSGTDGNFYGITPGGGFGGYGTVFKITAEDILSTLHRFGDTNDGAYPSSSLIRMTYSTIFYGTTQSTIFQLIGTNVTTLFTFGTANGPLLQSGDGTFYGTAWSGGAYGQGSIFPLSLYIPEPLSTPPVFIPPALNGGNVTLRWGVVAAHQAFQVQYKTNLTETVWSNLGSAIGTNTTSDAVGPGSRFYRVVILP